MSIKGHISPILKFYIINLKKKKSDSTNLVGGYDIQRPVSNSNESVVREDHNALGSKTHCLMYHVWQLTFLYDPVIKGIKVDTVLLHEINL